MSKRAVYVTLLITLAWTLSVFPVAMGLAKLIKLLTLSNGARKILLLLLRACVYGNIIAVTYWATKRLDTGRELFTWRWAARGVLGGLAAGILVLLYDSLNGTRVLAISPRQILQPWELFSLCFTPCVESVWGSTAYVALRRHHGKILSVVLTACMFSLAHLGDAVTLPGKSLMYAAGFIEGRVQDKMVSGIAFTGAYAATGSLAAPVTAHLVANLLRSMR